MPIALHVSNDLSVLASRLTTGLQGGGRDPFLPDWIVTQTEGMNDWLRQCLVRDLGIATNLRFCSPDDMVTQVRHWIQPTGRQPLDKETLRWSLFGWLGTEAFLSDYPAKAAYFTESDIRRISLADEMADLFDQYQIYRPGLLEEWEARQRMGSGAADWQEWLWRQILEQLGDAYTDRVAAKRSLRQALQDPEAQGQVLRRMPSLHVFGVAVITPYHLEIIYVLSQFVDVHIFLVNPAPNEYWLEDRTERQLAARRGSGARPLPAPSDVPLGNELLLHLGGLVKDSFSLLFQDQDMINRYDPEEVPPPPGDCLLHKIQRDIQLNLTGDRREQLLPGDILDGSLVLSGSYTPLREVEALYNHLVSQVQERADGISPRDILVQVTDIDLYAPFIQAVFGHATYEIPFSIADQSVTADNNMFTALQSLLLLDARQMKAEDVLELLESPYIRQRFGITDAGELREAVRQAGIVFSLEGRRDDDTRLVSWHHGLKRILYGLCLSGGDAYTDGVEALMPLDTAEGAAGMERIRLLHFMQVLERMLQERQAPRTVAGWAQYLRRLMEEMVFASGLREDEDHAHFVMLTEELSALDERVKVAVPFDAFRHSFLYRLTRQQRSRSFLSKGVTFCSMVPMRSIPFRIIALLGMDYDKFPRKDSQVRFSHLLAGEPRLGDRNIRNNDRHLFLETLLSAREQLYISYCSRDEKDAAERPPSCLVDELIDYVAKGMDGDPDADALRRRWLQQHPLHGFSRRYFSGEPCWRNYLPEARFRTGIDVQEGVPRLQATDLQVVDIDALAYFLQNPPRTYLQRQLNVRYNDEEWLLPDHELFELDSLQGYTLQRDLLTLPATGADSYAAGQSQIGALPLHNMGKALVAFTLEAMQPLRSDYQQACHGRTATEATLDIPLREGRITGCVSDLYGEDFVVACTASSYYKHLLAAYVRYLALLAAGRSVSLVFVTKSVSGQHRIAAGTIPATTAQERLEQFVDFYRDGHAAYFRFYPNLARKGFIMLRGSFEDMTDVLERLEEDPRNFEFKDDYLRKAMEHGFFSADTYGQLQENVDSILQPLANALPHLFT
ncbi:MAG: exodeoxyribonuclease V subunit gamma [Bacteroidetes bacterium]|nr:exodeoxyribonuclease V subunit gamma [Bacteroidota bacterium]